MHPIRVFITPFSAALVGTVLLTLFNLVANRVLHGDRQRR